MKRLIFCSVILFIFSVGISWAQFDVGLNFTVLSPESGFKENVDRFGYGATGRFAVKLGAKPLYAGLSIGGANYGSTSRREYLFPEIPVNVVTNNNILFTHLLLQARADYIIFQPYVEGLFGFNYLWTESKIEDVNDWDDEDVASHTNFDDFAWSYGAGFGVLINLKTFNFDNETDSPKHGRLMLDFRVRYLFGGEAEYLKEGSITQDENKNVIYAVNKSDTDFISYHVGLMLTIF